MTHPDPLPPGDGLPDQTADDTDVGWGERQDPADDDQRLLDERPPHHVDRD